MAFAARRRTGYATLSLRQPAFSSLALDGLGEGKTGANFLRAPAKAGTAYRVVWGEGEGVVWIEYRRQGTPADAAPGWRLEVGRRQGRLISQWSEAERPAPLAWNFDLQRCHAALLGLMNQDGSVALPALLHLPNQGSLRITSPANPRPALGYDTRQGDRDDENFVKVTFPAATPAHREWSSAGRSRRSILPWAATPATRGWRVSSGIG